MSTIIGIDLGTSTTEACVYRDGHPVMIPNLDGEVITPSAIGLDEGGNWVVGQRARAQFLLRPENTALEVKRKTGTGEKIKLGKVAYEPVELQSRMLSYVRSYVSEYLEEDVTRAVISVPAYFNDIQRKETLEAGQRAGFTVERIINEPTAAALSYGVDHMEEESHILVYDLGGGTFDVTLLEMFDGVVEVKATSGDNALGGKDFDEKLMDAMFTRFQKLHGMNLRNNAFATARIKEAAENCKKTLSTEKSCAIQLPAIATKDGKPLALDMTITRQEFESMTRELMDRTHDPIRRVMTDGEVSPDQIERILLVGGSTRMPMVGKDVAEFLGMTPESCVDPDFAVAQGASIQAAIISGEIQPEEGILMTDVNPYSLGIRSATDLGDHDCMSVVIPRNCVIPAQRTQSFWTHHLGQTAADIEVYQGESDVASHNQFLGEFKLTGIPANYSEREELLVTFAYDLNGLLKVTAKVAKTGKEAHIEIKMGDQKPDQEETEDLSAWKDAPKAKKYRSLIRTAERVLEEDDDDYEDTLDEDQLDALDDLEDNLTMLKLSLIQEDDRMTEIAAGKIKMALRELGKMA